MHPSTRVRFADAHVAPLEGDRYPSQDLLPSLLRPARGRTAHGLRPGLTFTAGVLACFGWIASGRRCSRNGASGIRVWLTHLPPYWPRVAPESRSCPSRDALASVDEDRARGKQRKRKTRKTNGQLLRVRPLHGCHAYDDPARALGLTRLQRRRHIRGHSNRSTRRDGPCRAAGEERLRIAHGCPTMHAASERQVCNPCMGDAKWECRRQDLFSWSTTTPRSGRPLLAP